MSAPTSRTHARWIVAAGVVVALGILAAVVLVTQTYRGQQAWLTLTSSLRSAVDTEQAVLDQPNVVADSQGNWTNVVFLHHSTGMNLIREGAVREGMSAAGLSFWDHDYNDIGLRRPDGSYTGYSYSVPNDNTDPDGLAAIFGQEVHDRPLNTLSGLMQHEVILFKSCFPVNQITSDEQLAAYQDYYRAMGEVMDAHPDKLFIALSPPPLNPAETTPKEASRARTFANWLVSDEFAGRHQNVYVFDFFSYLAEEDPAAADANMLRQKYRDGSDSHPNQTANETIGPVLVDFVVQAIETYRSEVQVD